MIRTIITAFVFITLSQLVFAERVELNNGVWSGSMLYSDGTERKTKYFVSTRDKVTEIHLEDEEDSKFHFYPVTVQSGKLSFLWNDKDKDSQCTLSQSKGMDQYQGNCHIFANLIVTLTMRPSAELAETIKPIEAETTELVESKN